MYKYICRENVDHFLHLLEYADLAPDRRATVTKLLIEEEDRFGHDLEQLQFAESRAASGRDRINFLRQKLDSIADEEKRAIGERLLANFEASQYLLDRFCHLLRTKAESRSSLG